jgi:hypothetical protein
VFTDTSVEELEKSSLYYGDKPLKTVSWDDEPKEVKDKWMWQMRRQYSARFRARMEQEKTSDYWWSLRNEDRVRQCMDYASEKVFKMPKPKLVVYNQPGAPTVKVKTMQDFQKRLREHCSRDGVRLAFFTIGEYGTEKARPHYHANVFCRDQGDNPFSAESFTEYLKDKISKSWDFGFTKASPFTYGRAVYCSGYLVKKQKGRYPARTMFGDEIVRADGSLEVQTIFSKGHTSKWNGEKIPALGYGGIPRYAEKIIDQAKIVREMPIQKYDQIEAVVLGSMNPDGVEFDQVVKKASGVTLEEFNAYRDLYVAFTKKLEFGVGNKTKRYKMSPQWRDKLMLEVGGNVELRKRINALRDTIITIEELQKTPEQREEENRLNDERLTKWMSEFHERDQANESAVT